MDVWCFDDDNNHSSSSSGSFPQMQFGGYWSSFSSIDDDYADGIFHEDGVSPIILGDSELQVQYDELKMLMESIDSTAHVPEDIFQSSQTGNFNHNSSLQIHNQPSLPSCNSIDSTSSNYMMQPLSSAPLTNKHCDARFSAATMEDIAITKAMLSVISSSSSSSSTSSPTCMTQQQQRVQTCHSQLANFYQPMSAFQPYTSSVPPVMKTHKNVHSQNMIKRAHNMLRSVNSLKDEEKQEETQPSPYQMQHMVSERRRRERLNASFQSLWQLLPPGSKKDKTSVLCNTMNYVRTLKAEVYELEEKNGEKVQVQICKSSEASSEMQQIDLVIMVRVQCDLIRVVLHVLECIKAMNAISLLSLDASPSSQQINLFATLKLAIMGSTWDERTFREAVTGAAHMALTVTSSTFPAFAVLDF